MSDLFFDLFCFSMKWDGDDGNWVGDKLVVLIRLDSREKEKKERSFEWFQWERGFDGFYDAIRMHRERRFDVEKIGRI